MEKGGKGTFRQIKTPNRDYFYNPDKIRIGLCMEGGIYTNERCRNCNGKLVHDENKNGFVCSVNYDHSLVIPKNCRVKFGRNVTRRFNNYRYEEASQFLAGLRYKKIEGTFDVRDYKSDNPLGFENHALKWLSKKEKETKSNTYRNLKRDIYKAIDCWGQKNIKTIGYGEIEDFLFDLNVSSKTRYNTWSCIHDFFTWVVKREKIPMPDMPDCSKFELGWRTIIDLSSQQEIINKVKEISWDINPKIWIGIKWLSTYVSIRPNECRMLKEGEINVNGFFVIPHPKEKNPKLVAMLDEDIELFKTFERNHPNTFFFRHLKGNGTAKPGSHFGKDYLYKWWKKACSELGIEGVDLYGGTRHSTTTALAEHFTKEELRDSGTMHATNKSFERYMQSKKNDSKRIYQKVSKMRGELLNLQERKNA